MKGQKIIYNKIPFIKRQSLCSINNYNQLLELFPDEWYGTYSEREWITDKFVTEKLLYYIGVSQHLPQRFKKKTPEVEWERCKVNTPVPAVTNRLMTLICNSLCCESSWHLWTPSDQTEEIDWREGFRYFAVINRTYNQLMREITFYAFH